jgi:hypothetical protein
VQKFDGCVPHGENGTASRSSSKECDLRTILFEHQLIYHTAKLNPSAQDFSPASKLQQPSSKYLFKKSLVAAPKKRPIHFLSLPRNIRQHILFISLDTYGYQEDQAMLKSLRKVTEVETDLEHAKQEWFKKMGICECCETQCCWDERDFGSIDARDEDFDLRALEFGKV